MAEHIARSDYLIYIYKKEDSLKYNAAIKALEALNRIHPAWSRIQGVVVAKDCRIPNIYHGDDLAIIMENDEGNGNYTIMRME
jgi:hypothetical protein